MLRDLSITGVTAGFVAVLVGYTGSAVLVFQAAAAAGATSAQVSSWLMALGLGMAVTTIGFSLHYRAPILTAWSTPGAALLATSLVGVSMSDAIGAFLFSALLITLSGITGWFERIMDRIPMAIAAAILAGVLLRFGMEVFVAMQTQLLLVVAMFAAYLLSKRLAPRYAIVVVFALGIAIAAQQDLLVFDAFEFAVATPVFSAPTFSLPVMIGVGIPLFVVTMASQNVPGIAVIRSNGYRTPISPLLTGTGLTTLVLAPFGGFAFNLAAITAAICMGKEAHPDPDKRYMASIAAGVFYLLLGVLGATVGALFAAFPKELVASIAGLALFATIAAGLTSAMRDEQHREPALITFLITASGVTLFGVGSAFWGLLGGVVTLAVYSARGKT
jgi:benzoate membrane transport protein